MNPAARIEDADPAQLVLMLEAALRWLQEEWFEPWLSDEALSDLAGDLDVDDCRQVQRLGTPYLQERLEEVTALVREMARGLDACRGEPRDAAARWAPAHRRPLAHVVDLYELAARRNAQVRAIVERAGWEAQPPGLLLSETAEDAFTILYEGLQRLAGILEDAARARGASPRAVRCSTGSSVTPGLTMAGSTRRIGVPGGSGGGAAAGDRRLSEPAVTKPVVPLAVGQVLALEAAMPARWRAIVSLGGAAGPRVSETLGLTVDRTGLTGNGDVGRRKPGSPVSPGRSGCGVNAHGMLTDCA